MSPGQKTRLEMLWETCRLKCRMKKSQAETEAEEREDKKARTVVIAQPGSSQDKDGLNKVALNTTVHQTGDVTVGLISDEEIAKCYDR